MESHLYDKEEDSNHTPYSDDRWYQMLRDAGYHPCVCCTKSFKTETGLESHLASSAEKGQHPGEVQS